MLKQEQRFFLVRVLDHTWVVFRIDSWLCDQGSFLAVCGGLSYVVLGIITLGAAVSMEYGKTWVLY